MNQSRRPVYAAMCRAAAVLIERNRWIRSDDLPFDMREICTDAVRHVFGAAALNPRTEVTRDDAVLILHATAAALSD